MADETVHNHDGFYFRFGFGVGYLSITTTPDEDVGFDVEMKATGMGPG